MRGDGGGIRGTGHPLGAVRQAREKVRGQRYGLLHVPHRRADSGRCHRPRQRGSLHQSLLRGMLDIQTVSRYHPALPAAAVGCFTIGNSFTDIPLMSFFLFLFNSISFLAQLLFQDCRHFRQEAHNHFRPQAHSAWRGTHVRVFFFFSSHLPTSSPTRCIAHSNILLSFSPSM